MKLKKKQCSKALEKLTHVIKSNFKYTPDLEIECYIPLEQLIDEHFKLVEKYEELKILFDFLEGHTKKQLEAVREARRTIE